MRILPFCDFLIGGKLDEIEFDLAFSEHNGSDHEFGDSALFHQAHLGPSRMKVERLIDHLFT